MQLGRRPATGPAMAVIVAVLVCASTALVALHLTSGARPAMNLVWSDEFDGSAGSAPNPATWGYQTGGWGWGNNELECYTDARGNSAMDGHGNLVITAIYQPGHVCADGKYNDYTSARLTTAGLQRMHEGHLRVRAQLPTASGAWPAIWALGDDHASVGWPRSGEIDVAEVIGSQPTTVHGSVHGPDPAGQPYTVTQEYHSSAPLSAGFHVYGLDWTDKGMWFSVDDQIYSIVTRQQIEAKGDWVFGQSFYLLLNLAVGGNWPGAPADTGAYPQRMLVDYVRVYS